MPLSLPSIYAASFLHPSLPYTSPIIALEQCQPPVGPQTAGLSSPSVLLLSPWPHLLNTLLVSGSVESHCGLTKEMWDWFLPLQIELKFSSCVCVHKCMYVCVCVCVCVSVRDREWKRERKVGKMLQKERKSVWFLVYNLAGTYCTHVHMHVACACALLFSSMYEGFWNEGLLICYWKTHLSLCLSHNKLIPPLALPSLVFMWRYEGTRQTYIPLCCTVFWRELLHPYTWTHTHRKKHTCTPTSTTNLTVQSQILICRCNSHKKWPVLENMFTKIAPYWLFMARVQLYVCQRGPRGSQLGERLTSISEIGEFVAEERWRGVGGGRVCVCGELQEVGAGAGWRVVSSGLCCNHRPPSAWHISRVVSAGLSSVC